MAPPPSERKYDLVVFGATGYTGKLTSEQLLLAAPSTLKWAIAGRSRDRLAVLAADYNARFPDRVPVDTVFSDLTEAALEELSACTRCLISTVGPYIKYGTPVVAACARNGTHYVDSTGEVPWVMDIIEMYHETARASGAIMIPQCGIESAPADLSAYSVVRFVREQLDCPVGDFDFAVHDIKSGISGGTLETTFCLFEHCSLRKIIASTHPYALSPIQGRAIPSAPRMRRHPDLGILTTWIQAIPDAALVMRSWGLREEGAYYGPRFTFREYRRTRNWLTAVVWIVLIHAVSVLPLIPPLRWLARKIVTQPGDGPVLDQPGKYRAEWRGVAHADGKQGRAHVTFRCEEDCYTLTGILLTHTALAILFDPGTVAREMGGGILTPSTVATERYFDGLERAGVAIEVKMMGSQGNNPSFFDDQPPTHWDIIAYLNQHDPNDPSYDHRTVIDRWTKTLAAIVKNDYKNYNKERRDRAQALLQKYNDTGRNSDRNRAREWLSHRTNTSKTVKSGTSLTIYKDSVVLEGQINNTTIHQHASKGGSSAALEGRILDGELNSHGDVSESESTGALPVSCGTQGNPISAQAREKRKLPDDWSGVAAVSNQEDAEEEQNQGDDIAAEPEVKKSKKDFPSVYNTFIATYKDMTPQSKFTFSRSRRVLEDVIYDNARTLSKKSLVHQWVLDLGDEDILSWFTRPGELDELLGRLIPLPESDKVFVASMARFADAENVAEYRRIAEEVRYRPVGESYNRLKHFDAAWVNTVILSMLSILESPNNLLLHPNLREGWFDCNPWAFVVDHCLLGLDAVLVQRKEILCLALKIGDNEPPPAKGNHGPRFDAIIHTLGDTPVIEYGAIEVARSFESTRGKKWIADSAKLVQALRAMLVRLHTLVDHNPTAVGSLQVVGLLNAGMNMQTVRLGSLGSNVFLLQRGKIRSIPSSVDGLKGIFALMKNVVMFKDMIRGCVKVVKRYSGGGGKGVQNLFEELMAQNEL